MNFSERIINFKVNCVHCHSFFPFKKPFPPIYMWTASIALGMGAGILWTSQGRFLTKCGTSETKKKNGGIFWAFLQGGALLGNIIVFIAFKDGIEANSRILAFTIFTILTSIGVASFKLLKHVEEEQEDVETLSLKKSGEENEDESEKSPMEVFKNSLALLTNKKMMIMMVVFIYSGISQVFVFGIHGTCVRTSSFGETIFGDKILSDQLMAVTGLFIAIGSMTAGVVDSYLGGFSTQVKFRVAMIVQIAAYFICVGNFGDDAAKGKKQAEVKDGAVLKLDGMYWEEQSSLGAAMLSSLLVAFGDGLMNTQIFFYLTTNFTGKNAAAAFSIFKSIQSFSVAGANWYASKLALGNQLGLAVVFSLASVLLYAFSGFNPTPTEPTKTADENQEST